MDAFRLLDLDGNGFLGAKELLHVLVCMGELVTTEEIDELISMLDSDGDGQVSLEEFYLMATAVDPGAPDFSVEKLKQEAAPPPPEGGPWTMPKIARGS